MNIFFIVKNRTFGSAILRGIQVSRELNNQGFQSSVIKHEEINFNTKNAIFIWVKEFDKNLISKLSDNYHIYDFDDNYIYQRESIKELIESKVLDHMLVNNNYMKSEIIEQNKISPDNISIIHHHWDPRVSTATKENQNNLTFGYLGSVASLAHTDNFLHYKTLSKQHKITFYDTENGEDVTNLVNAGKSIIVNRNPEAMGQLKINFNCHISIRKNNTPESLYKTSAKVVTAGALDHNIITTYEQATKDILPADYPFILKNTDLESVSKMLNLIKKDYNNKRVLWNKGLEIMSNIKQEYTIQNIVQKYKNIFSNRLL